MFIRLFAVVLVILTIPCYSSCKGHELDYTTEDNTEIETPNSTPKAEFAIEDFDFITENTTFQEVKQVLGVPDGYCGNGYVSYIYRLSDG